MKEHTLRHRGFSLIELMITVVIVAILASVAVPSYRNYIIRSQRTEAKTGLLRLQAAQEKFYLQNNRYVTTVAEMTADPPGGLGIAELTEGGHYKLSVAADAAFPGGQGYVATALPESVGQKKDKDCASFLINQSGKRDASPAGNVQTCWR